MIGLVESHKFEKKLMIALFVEAEGRLDGKLSGRGTSVVNFGWNNCPLDSGSGLVRESIKLAIKQCTGRQEQGHCHGCCRD